MSQQARDLIAFRQLNLHGDWPFEGKFDVIVCRNVAIYFDVPTQSTLWRRFGEALTDNGLLFIGHSEGIDPANSESFSLVGRGVFQHTAANKNNSTTSTTAKMGTQS